MRGHGEGSIYTRSDGRIVASIRYTDATGRRRRASAYCKDKRDARRVLNDLRRRIDDRQPVVDAQSTVGEWAQEWLSITLPASNRKATTQQTYSGLVRTHLVPALGAIRLRDLTVGHVERWIIDLGTRRSPSTVRQVHMLLVLLLEAAVDRDLLRRNVARSVPRPVVPRRTPRSYSVGEIQQLRSAGNGDRLEPFLTLTVFTGMRKGEVLALRWQDVEIDTEIPVLRVSGTLSRIRGELRRTEPKTSTSRRVVPLVPQAVSALRVARRQQARERLAAGSAWTDSGYVFTTEVGTPIDPRNALRWFYGLRDRAGLIGGSIHSLRHSAASVMLASSVPMPVVKEVLGHSSIAITVDLYGHLESTLLSTEMTRGMAGYGA